MQQHNLQKKFSLLKKNDIERRFSLKIENDILLKDFQAKETYD